ncbi:MAG: hypothetical protein EOP48_25310 [Sphingobacteriales bacterium]|nr:MAG: hypothetical protein EOP48_25310 [Sphingobacteriales bacterium]
MSNTPWFKAKPRGLGWGWVPCSSQGNIVLALYLMVIIVSIVIGIFIESPFLLLGVTFFDTVALLLICYLKGEKSNPLRRRGTNQK